MHTPDMGSSHVVLLASGVWSHNLTDKITYPTKHTVWYGHKNIWTTSPQRGTFLPVSVGSLRLWHYCTSTDHQSWGCKMERKNGFTKGMGRESSTSQRSVTVWRCGPPRGSRTLTCTSRCPPVAFLLYITCPTSEPHTVNTFEPIGFRTGSDWN